MICIGQQICSYTWRFSHTSQICSYTWRLRLTDDNKTVKLGVADSLEGGAAQKLTRKIVGGDFQRAVDGGSRWPVIETELSHLVPSSYLGHVLLGRAIEQLEDISEKVMDSLNAVLLELPTRALLQRLRVIQAPL